MLFLEHGIVPFREIIRKRRLGFLSYVLKEDEESMIYRFFESQRRNKTPKDWVTSVLSDIKELNIGMHFEDIKLMKKCIFKKKIEWKTLKDLNVLKEKHSKVKKLKHAVLKMKKIEAKHCKNEERGSAN